MSSDADPVRTTRRRPAVVLGAALVALVVVAVGGVLAVARPWEPVTGTEISVTGDVRVHDPALVVGAPGEPWFVYSTGDVRVGFGAPQVRRSDDGGRTWEDAGTAWDASGDPEWVRDEIDGVENYWAPAVVEHDGTWYLYYSASTFGSNDSGIGVATGSTVDPADPDYGWTDQGVVVRSRPGEDNFNAIDPTVVEDADGEPWLYFGSFWGGVQAVRVEWPSGKPVAGAEPVTVASRAGVPNNPIEAPALLERDGWYYLFVSWDSCCRGTDSTYRIAVGRSRDVSGPFLDEEGVDMALGGGTELLASDEWMVGPGGQSTARDEGGDVLAFHYYDAREGGDFRLALRELGWTEDGWPRAATTG
ncbi:arabinan endo-1,5-alpha-L-arabinosidase [Cellulosimicrobium terreum]|nr:arabinan endo-1,5-alpha-L-arabinosidase [Cellulosimicrobium terreum]